MLRAGGGVKRRIGISGRWGGIGEGTDPAGEGALIAEGVGVAAEVADDLEEALLGGGGGAEGGGFGEESGAGEFEDGVILAGGPIEVEGGEVIEVGGSAAGIGAGPEPGKDGVDGDVVEAAGTEEGEGLREFAGGEGAMAAPEAVGIGSDGFGEGAFGVGMEGTGEEPGFEAGDPGGIGDPGGGDGEAALGMIDGADAVEAPEAGGEEGGIEGAAIAPPEVPEAAGIGAGLGFGGEEAAEAEEAGFPGFAGEVGIDGVIEGQGEDFREALHGPGVVLVAEGAEEAFPEGLLPAGGAGAGAEEEGLDLEPDEAGLAEEVSEGRGGEFSERGGAVTGEPGGRRVAGAADPGFEFVEGGIEEVTEDEGGEGGGMGGGVPDDMEDDVPVGGVAGVAMGLPAGRGEIDFDVAGDRGLGAPLEDGAEEVGAGLAVPEAGVEDDEGLAVGGLEAGTPDALMGPDFLKPTFWGGAARAPFGKGQGGSSLGSPLAVEIRRNGHWGKQR